MYFKPLSYVNLGSTNLCKARSSAHSTSVDFASLILIRQLLNFSYFKSLDCNISYGSALKLLVEKAEVENFSWSNDLMVRLLNSQSRGPRFETCLAPRLIQHFILPRLIKRVPGPLGDLVVKSKLLPRTGSVGLRHLNFIHTKGP